MWVKICGNTRLEDCLVAAETGADAVGFVFAKGKRTVTAAQVAGITAELPDLLEKIGVFDWADASAVIEAARSAGLTGVQLHRAFDPVFAAAVRAGLPGVKLVQVVHWDVDAPSGSRFREDVDAVVASGLVDAVLVDSRTASASGGTGVTLDWDAAAEALEGVGLPVILAGGLRAENVAEAIAAMRPFGVDVSSGVESGVPGVKDAAKVGAFVRAARGV